MFTPLDLATRKSLIEDLELGEYDHVMQMREMADGDFLPVSDTRFDGERSENGGGWTASTEFTGRCGTMVTLMPRLSPS